ncbi:hypothetical protein [Paenibacillus hunanensis]|uniref:Na+/H+ antiporter NhaC n=1 Tax=Paenibacillus hunanensis TaxID=539262 RepID=A0ABU1IXN3_9BACL|nr:hypothetical protein [Paenibacillus hunanensis]MDR6243457.1 Na+/H+ antiporter NhaC [Paenibacillus hunanensis]GGI97865.1 hypothetical protein GCM10008022_03200 [Paenibacillus hunanensis]
MKWWILSLIISLIVFALPSYGFAAEDSAPSSVQQRIEEQQKFNPEEIGKNLEQKGNELMGMAQSGGKLYLGAALIVFLILLFIGLFFKKVRALAFLSLVLSLVGFFVIQYWQEFSDFVLAILQWFFTMKKGEAS